jgi:hypothetical protein
MDEIGRLLIGRIIETRHKSIGHGHYGTPGKYRNLNWFGQPCLCKILKRDFHGLDAVREAA